jgi:PAS domain S-box-containing protein
LCERAADQLGRDPKRLSASGRLVLESGDSGFAGFLGPAAGLFTSVYDLTDLATRWAGPALYRSHTFELTKLDELRFRFVAELRGGFTPCLSWFQILPGMLEVLPCFLGLPEAVVEVEHLTATSTSLVATAPTSRTLATRLRRLWVGLRSERALVEELAFQQRQLTSTLEALRRSEGGFRAALDAFPAFVALYERGRLLYVNPSLAAALRRPAAELAHQPLEVLFHPDDRPELDALQLAVEQGAEAPTRGRQVRLLPSGGGAIFVEVQLFARFEFGAHTARGLLAIDVTERQRMAETNRILMNTLPDLVMRITRDGTLLDVQGGGHLASTRATLAPMVGQQQSPLLSALVSPELIAQGREALTAAFESGEEQSRQLVAGEDERTYELRVVPRSDGAEALVLVRDVTQAVRDDRQLAITERMASLGTLAAGIAHEINNPLTFLTANHELLEEGLTKLERGERVDVAELRQLVDEAREGTRRVRDIVASLRTFSRVEVKVVPTPIDPVVAFDRALAICSTELRHKAVLERELTRVGSVLGDESQLIQVLVNLLMNAIQSLPEAKLGTIRVVSRADSGGRVRLEVQDTGGGIPPHVQKRIFDPFFTTKPPGQGTGLGLSISDRIIRDMGGELRVTSEVGRGSTFSVLLPPAPAAPQRHPPTRSAPVEAPSTRAPRAPEVREDAPEEGEAGPTQPRVRVAAGAPVEVLVVDDDLLVQRSLVRTLERAGHRVVAAESAEVALVRLGGGSLPDVILCDVMMPHTSGVELFERVRALRGELAGRFVFMTGGAFSDAMQASVLASGRPLLDKPLELAALAPYLTKPSA